jgi:hypothetical protein
MRRLRSVGPSQTPPPITPPASNSKEAGPQVAASATFARSRRAQVTAKSALPGSLVSAAPYYGFSSQQTHEPHWAEPSPQYSHELPHAIARNKKTINGGPLTGNGQHTVWPRVSNLTARLRLGYLCEGRCSPRRKLMANFQTKLRGAN